MCNKMVIYGGDLFDLSRDVSCTALPLSSMSFSRHLLKHVATLGWGQGLYRRSRTGWNKTCSLRIQLFHANLRARELHVVAWPTIVVIVVSITKR